MNVYRMYKKMRTKYNFQTATLSLLIGVALFTGCQSDDFDDNGTDTGSKTSYSYRITADVNASGELGSTRALSIEDGKIKSAWLDKDKLMAYCLSDNNQSTETTYSLLTSLSSGKYSGFEGELKTANKPLQISDEICFFYPGGPIGSKDGTIVPVVRKENTDGSISYEKQNTIKNLIKVDLTQQDGSIKNIGNKFDYQWAKVKPVSVNGQDVKIKVGYLKRQIAIWGVKFVDQNGKRMSNINEIRIYKAKSQGVFDLNKGEFVTDNPTDTKDKIQIPPERIDINGDSDGYFYIALLPGQFSGMSMKIYTEADKYTVIKFNKVMTFEADKVYHTTFTVK
ncbi:MAG: hypothetical protein ACOYJK_08905 [Prevotella sp.]|jgi:hypothetical protein